MIQFQKSSLEAGAPLWVSAQRQCFSLPPVVRPLTKAAPAVFLCGSYHGYYSLQRRFPTDDILFQSSREVVRNLAAMLMLSRRQFFGGKPPVTRNANAILQTLLRLLLAVAGWQKVRMTSSNRRLF